MSTSLHNITVKLATGNEAEILTLDAHSETVWFKALKNKDGSIRRPKLPDHYFILPAIQLPLLGEINMLSSGIRSYLHGCQVEIIKVEIENRYAKAGKCEQFDISAEVVSPEAISRFLAKSGGGSGNRLTGEAITTWLSSSGFADVLAAALEQKFPEATEPQIATVVAEYKTAFASLAAPNANIDIATAKRLTQALDTCNDDDEHVVPTKLRAKLDVIANRNKPTLSMAL